MYNHNSLNNDLNPFSSYNNIQNNNNNNIGYGNQLTTYPFSSPPPNNNNPSSSLYRQPLMMGSLSSMSVSSRGSGRGLNANDSMMDFEYLGAPPSSSSRSLPPAPQRQPLGNRTNNNNNNNNNNNSNSNNGNNYYTTSTTNITPSLSPINNTPYPYFPYPYTTTTTTTTTSSSNPVQEEGDTANPLRSNRTNTTATTTPTPPQNTTTTRSSANTFSILDGDEEEDDDDEEEEDEITFRPFPSMPPLRNPPTLNNINNINPPRTQPFVTKLSPISNIAHSLSQHQNRMSLGSFLLETGRPNSVFDLDRPFSQQSHCTCGRTNIALPPLSHITPNRTSFPPSPPLPSFSPLTPRTYRSYSNSANITPRPLPSPPLAFNPPPLSLLLPRSYRSFSNDPSFLPPLSPLSSLPSSPLASNPPPAPESYRPMVRVVTFSSNRSDMTPSLQLNHNVGSNNLHSYFFSRHPQTNSNTAPFLFSSSTAQAQAPTAPVIEDVDFVSTKCGLPKYKWHKDLSFKECGVCLDDFTTEVEVTELPCKHIFCTDCILQWLRKTNTCCLCRAVVPLSLFSKGEGIDGLSPSEAARSRRERLWQSLRILRQQMRENEVIETSTPGLPRIYLERSNIIQISRHAARRF